MSYNPNNDPILIVTLLAIGISLGWLTAMLIGPICKSIRRKLREYLKK